MKPLDPQGAYQRLERDCPESLSVRGTLKLEPRRPLSRLPSELSAVSLVARDCTWLRALPHRLTLSARLDISGCTGLTALPTDLSATSLVMEGCTGIETLPEGISLSFLNASGCTALASWPATGSFQHGHLTLRNCIGLRTLPRWIESVAQLDLAGCVGISELPEGMRITSFLDLADTGITKLPPSLSETPLRWRGAPIDARIAFEPETISVKEVLEEPNVELRRAKLARIGYERFLADAQAQPIHEDHDRGGPRRLFRVELDDDEPLVCLSVLCPSTGRRYLLRVPPDITRCHDAAAWVAGFDDPTAYAPELET